MRQPYFTAKKWQPLARGCLLVVFLLSLLPQVVTSAQQPAATDANSLNVEQIAAKTRSALVSISTTGRDGRTQGIGTGFIVDKSGLIATNLHVIGDARPFQVEMSDGRKLKVTAIRASDRKMDLAVIRVAEQDLPPLTLGDPSKLNKGAPIVVMGNPHGLKHSVVSGVNSGIREIDGRTMLQLAIPIEPGNSGVTTFTIDTVTTGDYGVVNVNSNAATSLLIIFTIKYCFLVRLHRTRLHVHSQRTSLIIHCSL